MEEKDVFADLYAIRKLMERSSKFISLSGLSGILSGIYALAGARMAMRIIDNQTLVTDGEMQMNQSVVFWPLILMALVVLILSIVTSYWLTMRKAKIRRENAWNPVSRRMLAAIAVPMFTGGLFIGLLLLKGEYSSIASACLVFYGLALVAGSPYTYNEIRWLGLGEILLGLLALYWPMLGLLFWAVGFGLMHIVYGVFMYFKYER